MRQSVFKCHVKWNHIYSCAQPWCIFRLKYDSTTDKNVIFISAFRFPNHLFSTHQLLIAAGCICRFLLLGCSGESLYGRQCPPSPTQGTAMSPITWLEMSCSHIEHIKKVLIPFFLHLSLCMQFFPYILLLVAIIMYIPALLWRFTATPSLSSDLNFIMEELDRCYNRAIRLAKSLTSDLDGKDTAEDPHRYNSWIWQIIK